MPRKGVIQYEDRSALIPTCEVKIQATEFQLLRRKKESEPNEREGKNVKIRENVRGAEKFKAGRKKETYVNGFQNLKEPTLSDRSLLDFFCRQESRRKKEQLPQAWYSNVKQQLSTHEGLRPAHNTRKKGRN